MTYNQTLNENNLPANCTMRDVSGPDLMKCQECEAETNEIYENCRTPSEHGCDECCDSCLRCKKTFLKLKLDGGYCRDCAESSEEEQSQ